MGARKQPPDELADQRSDGVAPNQAWADWALASNAMMLPDHLAGREPYPGWGDELFGDFDGDGSVTVQDFEAARTAAERNDPLQVVTCKERVGQEIEHYLFGVEDEHLGVHAPDSARGVFERCQCGTVYLEGLEHLGEEVPARLLQTISARRLTRCGG